MKVGELDINKIELISLINSIRFKIGDMVYHKTDPEQNRKLVIGYNIRKGHIVIVTSNPGSYDTFYDFELSYEKSIF